VRPGGEIGLVAAASVSPAEVDEVRAQRDAEHALARLEALARLAPEVAAVATDKPVHVRLISEYGPRGFEICAVAGGQVEWKVKGHSSGAST
jgi:hypothetical protein